MPIDLNEDTPKSLIFFSETVELLSSIQLLVIPAHHEFANDWAKDVYKLLSEESHAFLKCVANFPTHGLTLFEFILDSLIFDDVDQFINKVKCYSDAEFVGIFTDHSIDETFYNRIVNKEIDIKEIEKRIPYSIKESITEIYDVIFDTHNFKLSFVKIMDEIANSSYFKEHLLRHSDVFKNSVQHIKSELIKKRPLDLSQELMGKKFGRVFDYKTFIFCPSYFMSPHRLRLHHQHTNVVIYDVRRDHIKINQIGESISNQLKVIADRTRLEILRQLMIAPSYGKELAKRLDLTTATISHHLEQLKQIGLVSENKVKNLKYFYAVHDEVNNLFVLSNNYLNNKL